MKPYTWALICLTLSVCHTNAAELRILPPETTLTGPHASQRLIAVALENGQIVQDRTRDAHFTSSNPQIASVDASGIVCAIGDGRAVISAIIDGKKISSTVQVVKTRAPFTWSFRNHVIPMMTKIGCNSGACHGALAGKGGLKLSLRGYAPLEDHFVLTRQARGRRINKLEPAHSLMLLKPTMAISHGGGQKLEVGSADYQLLLDWIASGAPGPRADEPRITRLEIFPKASVLKPRDTLQILVRAWYSDGHSEDVTRWGKFSSSEDLVAAVDPDGRVRVSGHGQAAIAVWYSNLVATAWITSPLENQIDPHVFRQAERHNFVDELVLQKLETLHVPPSPVCSDTEFIRRAYLDAAGILPTPADVRRFQDDRRPDKRARLIDRLLRRPEFVDYWAYKWSDLLLVSTRRLARPDLWSFYQYIRQSVADNKPWDRFAREILTAQGSTLRNGAANYFVLHKDVTDLTEATSVTFLGMSLTCCRCHNHPLEKWTQDQYWEMASLFGRVGLKNGERADEVIVESLPSGEVLHPRRSIPMPPTPLDARPLPPDSPMDRREYLARWITAPENPYFARAIVNRVWRNFLGRGLVEAEDDIRQTNPASNQELFEALARDFVKHGYDVKGLMRTIMNSATYQRSSRPVSGNESDDRYYSHYLIRRLPAEVILDAYAQVTGVPTPFTQINTPGRSEQNAYGDAPLGLRALQLPDSAVVSPFLDAFGRPERVQTCSCERDQDSSVAQALHLDNGHTLNDKLRSASSLPARWVKEKISDDEAIQRIFVLALCRKPTRAEADRFQKLMAEGKAEKAGRREVLEDLCWAVLTGREFLFNH